MKNTKHTKPEGKKYRVKSDVIYDLYSLSYIEFQTMSLWPEAFTLEEVQNKAIEKGIEIFENKKK